MTEPNTTNIDKLIKSLEDEMDLLERSRYGNTAFYGQKHKDIDKIKERIMELEIRKATLLDSYNLEEDKKHKEEHEGTNVSTPGDKLSIDEDKQTIRIGTRSFNNFVSFFELLRIQEGNSVKKSQIKSGVALIYTICRYTEEKTEKENMLVHDLIGYYREFRDQWGPWGFQGRGTIGKNDCIRANEILGKCGLSLRFKLTKDKQEILITK